jgi:hypothetical protein
MVPRYGWFDVRALELFAGRTEALRDAVALEQL